MTDFEKYTLFLGCLHDSHPKMGAKGAFVPEKGVGTMDQMENAAKYGM